MLHDLVGWFFVVIMADENSRRVPKQAAGGGSNRLILEELQKINLRFDALEGNVYALQGNVYALTRTSGALAESKLRMDAKKDHGDSFAKGMVVRSLSNLVHFACKEKHGYLHSQDSASRERAVDRLVATANIYKIPVVGSFVRGVKNIIVTNKDVCEEVADILSKLHQQSKKMDNPLNLMALVIEEEHSTNPDYELVLGLLLRACGSLKKSMPKNVIHAIKRLKKAFENPDDLDNANLKSLEGPGVMLLHIASKFEDVNALMQEDSIFSYLHEEVGFDMRGTITLSDNGNVTIACGEAKSCSKGVGKGVGKAKQQIVTRAHFLRTAIKSMFPETNKVAMTGEIYVLDDAPNLARNCVDQEVSIKIVPNR
jgi:hypothetical protein